VKIYRKCIRHLLFIVSFLFTMGNTQLNSNLIFRSGSLSTEVDIYSGRFGILDIAESNLDLASVLFIGPALSSYININIDGKTQTFDQMQAIYPLGLSFKSQIDGIFLAGYDKDIQVEVAYFSMDINSDSDRNTVGIVIKLSNISQKKSHNVSVKIMLDTDIGENQNNPLIYLPSKQRITNSFLLTENNLPPYLFLGRVNPLANYAKGQGFYIYPNISSNKPKAIVIANWRRLNDEKWIPTLIAPSFRYQKDNSKDAGIALYFGEYELEPDNSISLGIAISKRRSSLIPLLDNIAIDKGVFTPERFTIEEMLNNTNTNVLIDFQLKQNNNSLNQSRRQIFRQKLLGIDNMNLQESNIIELDANNIFKTPLNNDDIWNTLIQMDMKVNDLNEKINRTLDNNYYRKEYDSPPSEGIEITNFFEN